jgi:transcriptional regulator with GAF, ATPase, and Fis domain
MGKQEHIDIDLFKVVTRAITHSDTLDAMTAYLSQLLVASLGIKGCSVFAVNPETEELEILGSFGLSVRYLNKGPVLSKRSIARTIKGDPVVVTDIEDAKTLQYPEEAKKEGIRAIASLPIKLYDKVIGALRLYHHDVWKLSSRDLDSLLVLTEVIGLAMVYMRLYHALQVVKEAAGDVHMVWLGSKSDR